jgi:hypothetical protein
MNKALAGNYDPFAANANLIAAAPELLQYLGYALVYVKAEDHPFACKIAAEIQAIMAKAEGRP